MSSKYGEVIVLLPKSVRILNWGPRLGRLSIPPPAPLNNVQGFLTIGQTSRHDEQGTMYKVQRSLYSGVTC